VKVQKREVLGVDRETPGYIVRNGLRMKAGKGAAKFEDKMDGEKRKSTEKKEREIP
jgi:hypothetical protein